jgi:MFS family permease
MTTRDGGSASFVRYWTADAISAFGTAVTAVALPVLVVQVLGASPAEVGLVNAAQFVPYAVLGLLAGAYVDRWRRKPVLVWASVGRALTLGLVPLLWLWGLLEIWVLVVLLLAFGAFAVFGFAASQSLLPHLVARSRLLAANARLDQTDAAAQTAGPALGGGLITLLGAPLVIALDAVTYLVQAAVVAGIRVDEPARTDRAGRRLGRDIGEGLRWTYRHRTLAPLAVSTHVWFVANAAGLTALALLALRDLDLSPVAYGWLFTVAGLALLAGAALAPAAGRRLGAGRAIVVARSVYPLAWFLVAAVAVADPLRPFATEVLLGAMALQGLVAGLENANEMAYRQAVTPDALLGRTSATIRAANRTAAAIGALLAGVAVGAAGVTPTLIGVAVAFAVAAAIALASPLRSARHEDGG